MGATHAIWTGQTRLNCTDLGVPDHWALNDDGRTLHVLVLFTDVPGTLEALRYAATYPTPNIPQFDS